MNVHGSDVLAAPRAEVYAAICDPAVLLEVIPGCESVERVAEDEYRARIVLRLPGAVGAYATSVRLVDPDPPSSAAMEGTVEGAMGSIRGRAAFELSDAGGGTRIEYRGEGTVTGALARLDSRFAERLAESLIAQGLRALDRRLAHAVPPGAPAGPRAATEGPE